ncbi:hypothetical protein ABZ943_00050 [Streptomyces rubiginosohelvolus]|uniref:ATP-dependent DNA ligase n=1 Tax=Streptomyces rubiginosohelvolus TaxID=67362 RepID=UPI0033C27295
MANRIPAHLMLVDAVHLDGRLLAKLPYADQRGLLEGLGRAGPAWSTPAEITGHGAQAYELAKDAEVEGLIAKRLNFRYEPGASSKTLVKIKVHRIADVVIGGWVPRQALRVLLQERQVDHRKEVGHHRTDALPPRPGRMPHHRALQQHRRSPPADRRRHVTPRTATRPGRSARLRQRR